MQLLTNRNYIDCYHFSRGYPIEVFDCSNGAR